MLTRLFPFFAAVLLADASLPAATQSLAGDWQVQLNAAGWEPTASSQTVRLPGSIQAQGLGDDISTATKWIGGVADKAWLNSPRYEKYRQKDDPKIPFWLQPAKHFVGSVACRCEFTVPAAWAGKRIALSLERVHVSSVVLLDGKEVGRDNSLSTPHRFELGHLTAGPHELVIVINNTPIDNIGDNSHCVSDHMQTAWNGVVGEVRLEATPDTWLDAVQVYPDVVGKRLRVTWQRAGQPVEGQVSFTICTPEGRTVTATAAGNAATGETTILLGDTVTTWDEFSPRLYQLEATLTLPNAARHTVTTAFGLVDYRTEGRHFLVNGRPTIFRGTLDCAMFPLTGYPSTDLAYWKKEFAVIKAHGLNHVRFHSWCPPEAAFAAADEVGVYLLIEHAWTAPEKAGAYLMSEAERVVQTFGNHPSFAMHAYGNEPTKSVEWMEEFARHFREKDPRRFYAGSIGWPELNNNQFHSLMGGLRVYPWGAGLRSSINAEAPNTLADFGAKTQSGNVPVISHETGQWCVYPDFTEIPKYTGFLKAKNLEIFRDFLAENQMADQARDFLMATGRLQVLCYKYEIEKLLRSPDIGGYQLLGLNDFPGQGTALVGVVNPFWETKPYTTAAEYSRFSGPTVPLARLPKFVFTAAETLRADLEISHYAAAPLLQAVPTWKLVSAEGKTLATGRLPARDIPLGQAVLGKIEVPLAAIPVPSQIKLVVGVADTAIENHWDLWVYPSAAPQPPAAPVLVTHNIKEALEKARAGARVLLLPSRSSIVPPEGPKVVFGFSTIFWNTAWSKRQPPTTMGILCDPKHPALAGFPTESHSNYQWWYPTQLVARPLSLQGQAPEMRPIVQVIDDWFTARRLALLVEANYGQGRLLISAIDFDKAPADDVVSAQLRASLLTCMASPDWTPKNTLDDAQLSRIINPNFLENELKARVTASSQNSEYPAADAYDGDSTTFWHSEFKGKEAKTYPHELQLELEKPVSVCGLKVLPRQDESRAGWVKDVAIQVSRDGQQWATAATGTLNTNPEDWSEFRFPAVSAKFVKIIAVAPQKPGDTAASFAEVELMREK
jgi:hypothetical protein